MVSPTLTVGVLVAPDPEHREPWEAEHEEEGEGVDAGRPLEPEGADVEHDQHRGAVERRLRAARPGLDLAPPLAPDEIDEERDREQEGDLGEEGEGDER